MSYFILFFILICISTIIYILSNESYQNVGTGYVTQNTNKCNNLNMSECLKMQNCGYAVTNHSEQCLAGNTYGPYNKKITKESGYKWYHNDPYTRALIANDNNYRNTDINVFDV